MLKVNASTGEIFIYDVIGSDWFGEGITGSSVTSALKELGNKRAVIRINSPGGVADEGIAIYNILKRHKAGVDTYNDSIAASAASIIFLAGENRYAAKGSRVMIHKASAVVWGNADEVRKQAGILDKYDESLVEIYSEYMGLENEAIAELLARETWYTTDEAIAAKLATATTATESKEAKVASWFRNAPAALLSKQETPRPISNLDYDLAVAAKKRFQLLSR
jgi:ATP-dependent Clp protease, protease subunit